MTVSRDVVGGHPTDDPKNPFTKPHLAGKTPAEIFAAHNVNDQTTKGCECDHCEEHRKAQSKEKSSEPAA